MEDQQIPITGTPIYQESQGRNAKWLWLLIALIIAGALVFAFLRGIGPFSKFSPFERGEEEAESLPASSPFSFSSPTATATVEASPTIEVDKSEPKIRVLNGSGRAGAAGAVKNLLEGKGYKVVSIGNADNFDYSQTVLRFKETFLKFKEVLTKDLSDDYSVATSDDGLEATDSADIEVIVGAK